MEAFVPLVEPELKAPSVPEVLQAVRTLLLHIGEDPERPGLLKTPDRVMRMLSEMSQGLQLSEEEVIGDAIYEEDCFDLVVVEEIEFTSLCEHHLLPFIGTCTVAYLPNGKVIGLSKIARIVDFCARRPQLQERLTQEISDLLMRHLQPLGVAVQVRAQHQCMAARGVKKNNARMVSRSFTGVFKHSGPERSECLSFFNKN